MKYIILDVSYAWTIKYIKSRRHNRATSLDKRKKEEKKKRKNEERKREEGRNRPKFRGKAGTFLSFQ